MKKTRTIIVISILIISLFGLDAKSAELFNYPEAHGKRQYSLDEYGRANLDYYAEELLSNYHPSILADEDEWYEMFINESDYHMVPALTRVYDMSN